MRTSGSRRARIAAASAGVVLCAAACGKDRSPPLEQPVGETHTYASSTGSDRPRAGPGRDTRTEALRVVIGADVKRACGLPDDAREPPRFDFDSARLRPRGDDVFVPLVACVAADRVGEATIQVIGYADPRGTDAYSDELGMYRAVAAKQHLVDLGVPSERIAVESRGERDAKGTDEPSWALDRRVEVHLLGVAPPPSP